jgi:hypothetical protein
MESLGVPDGDYVWIVDSVYDSLDEVWEPGEHAWAQTDHDRACGKKGEWYVICHDQNHDGETVSFGSYEVEVIV